MLCVFSSGPFEFLFFRCELICSMLSCSSLCSSCSLLLGLLLIVKSHALFFKFLQVLDLLFELCFFRWWAASLSFPLWSLRFALRVRCKSLDLLCGPLYAVNFFSFAAICAAGLLFFLRGPLWLLCGPL